MKHIYVLVVCGCLLAFRILSAGPPRCEQKRDGGQWIETCSRADINCEVLVREDPKYHLDDPNWNGCARPVLIVKITDTRAQVPVIFVGITVVASYRDSERMDLRAVLEQADHTFRTLERKDIPIVIKDGIPQASIDFYVQPEREYVGVPTVEAIERGGKKMALHIFK